MYKVLNEDNKVIVVESVDIKKHRHLSGREFTKDDNIKTSVIKKVIAKKKK